MRLQGKVAVITGAGSGMGLAMATRFAAEGASVVAGDWNAQRLDAAVASIQASGGTIVGAQGNIADQATAENLIDLALSTYGRLDVLCNNAGVMDYMQGVGELSDDIWRRVLSINLDGPMFTSRRAIQHMLAQGSGSTHQHCLDRWNSRRGRGCCLHRLQARTGRSHAQYGLDVRHQRHSL